MDHSIWVWNIDSASPLYSPLIGHTSKIRCVVWSQSGELIIASSQNGSIRTWDARSGTSLYPEIRHTSAIISVVCSPNDKHILAIDNHQGLTSWDIHSGTLAPAWQPGELPKVYAAAYSPDGCSVVVCAVESLRLCDAETGAKMLEYPKTFRAISYHPNGEYFVTAGNLGFLESISIWDTLNLSLVKGERDAYLDGIFALRWSTDGTTVVCFSNWGRVVRLWDGTTGDAIGTPADFGRITIEEVSIAPDGRTIATASRGRVILWDIEQSDD